MSIPAAFLGVVVIWATTPLAIKWSSEGAGFLFGIASRMLLGVAVCLMLIAVLRRRLPWHRHARRTYLAAGLGLWGAMTSVYWAAQFIPSGLISVLFGLTPAVTGVMAALWLGEQVFTPFRLLGLGLGVAGLGMIFGHSLEIGPDAVWGVAGIILAVHIHSASSVWVKRIGAQVPALETTTGALLLTVPLFMLTWLVFDAGWPSEMPARAAWSIVYLAVFGSTLGFMLYFYVLRKVQASRVALITLVSPVIALFLGQWINAETLTLHEWLGTATILGGLASFQWGDNLFRPRQVTSHVPTVR